MKLPPFEIISFGRLKFQCLAHCSVLYGRHRAGSGSRGEAICGLYFTQARSRHEYWLKVFRNEHYQLAGFPAGYSRQGVSSALLTAAVYHKIVPSAWQLFPLGSQGGLLRLYRKRREELADVLWPYRMACGVVVEMPKLLAEPLFEVSEDYRFLPIGL